MLRDPNPITGCTTILQIEYINLEFNIKVFLFFSFSPATLSTVGRRQAAAIGGG